MTADLAELAAWIEVLARPDVQIRVGYDPDGPVISLMDLESGRSSEWLLEPV